MYAGKFITLEGIDGAGKSTQLAYLSALLQQKQQTVVVTREPGGTALGERLRALLLDQSSAMHPETEALLMFAARREHIDKVIVPALQDGSWVVSDRFTDASFAYQGGGRQIDREKLALLEQWVQGGLQPDLTLFFDVPIELGLQRVSAMKTPDRFEQERQDFFRRVRDAYLARACEFPQRIHIIDARQPVNAVKAEVASTIETLCAGSRL
ncbi:dTMP kinase [Nitrosomonas sp. Nm51]|uniref:dTMP kinase n=1 Tax=Nitrosomonas sp. Nm51 TaxID=133720 RepID=UPI000B884A3A|nr:dTMP kinase [Nitrosomonas sp. Nm51]